MSIFLLSTIYSSCPNTGILLIRLSFCSNKLQSAVCGLFFTGKWIFFKRLTKNLTFFQPKSLTTDKKLNNIVKLIHSTLRSEPQTARGRSIPISQWRFLISFRAEGRRKTNSRIFYDFYQGQ